MNSTPIDRSREDVENLPAVPGFSYAFLTRCMAATYGNVKPSTDHPSRLLDDMRASVGLADMPPGPECVERLFTQALGFEAAEWLEFDEDTRGVAATRGSAFLWVDQGTQNMEGWASNVRRARTKWSALGRPGIPGKVHAGFGRSALDQHEELMSRSSGAQELGLVGHSRGGAHATCHAALALDGGRPVQFLVTAGKPRVGNAAFAGWLSSHAALGLGVRMVRNNDIVARLPTAGFRHEGAERRFVLLWIEHDGDISIDPDRWDRFKDRLVGRIAALDGGEPTVAEVPDLTMRHFHALEDRGLHLLRKVIVAGAAKLAEVIGSGPAKAVMDWALERSKGLDLEAGVFDGLHDHGIDLYARDLEAAGV